MKALAFIEGQVDEVEKERNTMTCQLKEKGEQIFLLKSNVISLKIESHEVTRMMEEMKKQLVMCNNQKSYMQRKYLKYFVDKYIHRRIVSINCILYKELMYDEYK